jgi:threonyl-tRNA synthetase
MSSVEVHDHRAVGQRLQLFHLQEEAPGMVFWHPRGWALLQVIEARLRRQVQQERYHEVRTPQVLGQSIWQRSGHWDNFSAGMLTLDVDERPAGVKPVSCPGHIQIVERLRPSHHDLPLRLCEFGLCHRNEPRGALLGLMRLRQFTQDDGHIFCGEAQVEEEVARFCANLQRLYRAFGFDAPVIGFATRPEGRAGSDALWDKAEAALEAAARAARLDFEHRPGEGAFYGPKLEWALPDRQGRLWQCGTIQLDLVLPERFDVGYVDARGGRQRPVMLHRALVGSLERFAGLLLERHGAALPAWLAPEQVAVLPVGAGAEAYGAQVRHSLEAAGLRVAVDQRGETLSRKVAEVHAAGIPFAAVVGKQEAAEGSLAVRGRHERFSAPLPEAVARLAAACSAEGA